MTKLQNHLTRATVAVALALGTACTALAADFNVDSSTSLSDRNTFAPSGSIANNKVTVSGVPSKSSSGDNTLRVYGSWVSTGEATGNEVTISGDAFNQQKTYAAIIVSGAAGTSDLKNNTLIVKGAKIVFSTSDTPSSALIGAGLRIDERDKSENWYKDSYAGWTSQVSWCQGNKVEISNSTLSGAIDIIGGAGGFATKNEVLLLDGVTLGLTDDGTILGGEGYTASQNKVTLASSGTLDFQDMDIAGAHGEAAVTENSVVITKGSVLNAVITGGIADQNVIGNHVDIDTEGTVTGAVIGGAAIPGIFTGKFDYYGNTDHVSLSKNAVNITRLGNKANDGNNNLDVFGTYTSTAIANTRIDSKETAVTLGAVNVNDVFGDAAAVDGTPSSVKSMTASPVIKLNGTTADNVIAVVLIDDTNIGGNGSGSTSTLTDIRFDSVDITGAKIELNNATVRGTVGGMVFWPDQADNFIPATGHFGSVTGSVALTASGVNRIGVLGDDVKNITLNVAAVNKAKPVIIFTGVPTTKAVALASLDTEASTQSSNTSSQKYSDLNIQVNRTDSSTGDVLFFGTEGTSVTLDNVTITCDDTFTTTKATNTTVTLEDGQVLSTKDLKAAAETSPTVTTTVNENAKTLSESLLGSVALVNQGAEFMASEGLAAINAAASTESVTAFGAVSAGSTRYETGSHVDVDGGSYVLGAATKVGSVTLAGYAELGYAESEAHVKNTKADGEHTYYGVGVAARYDFEVPFYVEGSVRVGQAKTEFDGYYGSTNEKAKYDAKSVYTSAHIGAGYVFTLTDSLKLDAYGRYLYTYLGSDKVTLTNAAHDKLKLDATTTQTVQLGVKVKGEVSEKFGWNVGAAYEHVFGGDADSWLNGQKIVSPSVSGNSGILEAGASLKPSAGSPWKFDFGVKGYVGDRRGATGFAQVQYLF